MESLAEILKRVRASLQAGDTGAAEALCTEALRRFPGQANLLQELASLAYSRGEVERAERYLREAIQHSPQVHWLHNNLGVLLEGSSRYADATAAYLRAAELNPDHARIQFNLANCLRALERFGEAETRYRRAIELQPDFADAIYNLAVLLNDLSRRTEAEELLRRVIALSPGMVDAHVTLGTVLQGLGRDEEALERFSAARRLAPAHADATAGEAGLLLRRGDFDEACERLLPLEPLAGTHPDVAVAFASVAHRAGRQAAAEAALRAALALPQLRRPTRRSLLFSMGKLLDRGGRFEEAFGYFKKANELSLARFDLEDFRATVERLMATFDAAFLERAVPSRCDTGQPIFIVGMPRSGTSLVEQILASHPEVHGAGELPDLERAAYALPGMLPTGSGGYPECVRALTPEAATEAAGRYLAALRHAAPDATRIIDKMPGNFLHLGLVQLLLPRARVIHVRRDPLDTCLSCYFQHFNEGHAYSTDLRLLGAVYRLYERIMQHWNSTLQLPMLTIDYEELVAAQEAGTRRLLEFCDLGWDARCLRFHETRRPVRTASFEQVREPIYRRSLQRHRHYAEWLQPLREALHSGEAALRSQGGLPLKQ